MSMMEGKKGKGAMGVFKVMITLMFLNLSSWVKSEGEDIRWLVNNKFTNYERAKKLKVLKGTKNEYRMSIVGKPWDRLGD